MRKSQIADSEYSVDDATGCWNWMGYIRVEGYGSTNGEMAHRAVYRQRVGPIPDGLDLDHLCRNRRCVNPEHMEPVTHRENMLRGDTIFARNAAKTHCPAGHRYNERNTYVARGGKRKCRPCNAVREREYRQRKREVAA